MTTITDNPVLQEAAKKGKRASSGGSLVIDYSSDELEFLKAMDRYKRQYHRPNPTCCEVLAVLKTLGYRKVEPVAACGHCAQVDCHCAELHKHD